MGSYRVLLLTLTVSSGRVDVVRVGYERDTRSGFAKRGERQFTPVAQWRPSAAFQVRTLLSRARMIRYERPSCAIQELLY